jgi:bifunctional DNase/RNase
MSEATAISFALEGTKSQRPMTHDLLMNVIEELGYCVKHVEIDKFADKSYRATIHLMPKDWQVGTDSGSVPYSVPANHPHKLIDARPSDAIAIALASRASIFVSQDVVDTGTYPLQSDKKNLPSTEEFKSFIENVNASDFNIDGLSVSAPDDDQENRPSGPSNTLD